MTFYAGFDAAVFPGVETMAWLKSHSNLAWCGYYLAPAPNLAPAAASWRGQRAALAASWGMVPIYVGQQSPAVAAPDQPDRPGQPDRQFSTILTAAQGSVDGAAAVALAVRDGFPAGSYLYIDWEDGSPLGAPALDYLGAWLAKVDGRGFGPGIYCSHRLGEQAGALLATLRTRRPGRIWCFKVASTALHPLADPLRALPRPDPAGSAYAGALLWQREQNAWFDRPDTGQRIVADFNSAAMADPGAPPRPSRPGRPRQLS